MDYSVDKGVEINNAVPLVQQGTEYTTVYSSNNDSCSNGNVLSGNGNGGGGGNYVFINIPGNSLPPVVQPMLPEDRMTKRPWHYGLFACASDCNACCESWCCTTCQISRQCNMIWNNTPEINWLYCLMMSCGNFWFFTILFSCIGAMQVRTALRQRYGLAGSDCGDVCAACFCQCCVVNQALREMISMNEFPGASCFQYVTPRLMPVMN